MSVKRKAKLGRRYPKIEGWFRTRRSFRVACCDCHLVHKLELRVRGGKLEMRMTRLNKNTWALRKHRAIVARATKGEQISAMRAAGFQI